MWGKRKKDELTIPDFVNRINHYIDQLVMYQQNWLMESKLDKNGKSVNMYKNSAEKADHYISVLRTNANILNRIMPPRDKYKRDDLMKRMHSTLSLLENTANILLPIASMRDAEPYVNELIDLINQMTCT